ncbi:helix-turn-helix domain-containing protein [Streptomyces sp. ID05-47C]|uniref:AraC-like ligand-binding domain-containing protein n=1 Tax=Streptomyces sp. ID05-47C TaxID=3028665 RepID=UPI0029B6B561|nr:helix-turn-helix domain-containing protein [Streptomyces sp. ID05-47C]MDX3569049.1 helix-turn-helix domain-containing protein [Streptomyces sp. ID05-47C]
MSIPAETPGRDTAAVGPVVTVSTDSLPAPDRFDWWVEMVAREVMPVSVHSAHAARFRGTAQAVELPRSQVTEFGFSPMVARRSPAEIRRHDPEEYFLVLVRGSPIRLEQGRGVACLGAGDMALFSTSHPLACDFLDRGRQCRLTLLRLPRSALPLAGGRADRLLAQPLPAGAGSAALLGPYLAGLPEAARSCGLPELARLGSIAADLAASAITGRLGTEDTLPVETRKALLLAQIKTFIHHHLADPQLRPAAIAAHHHISVRTLHLLFRSEPETVAAMIRRQRLKRCHADLTDPGLHHRAIAQIAASWGFLDPADFSRTFRATYGLPPREVRTHARTARLEAMTVTGHQLSSRRPSQPGEPSYAAPPRPCQTRT